MIGGIALSAVCLLTVSNIIGRALIPIGLSPVPGDFELVEFLIAFSIFHFLPWCQLQDGHISVDIFLKFFPAKFTTFSKLLSHALMFVVMLIIALRLWSSLLETREYGEVSFILQIPIWWNYLLVLPVTFFSSFIALYNIYATLTDKSPSSASPAR